jgi:hypothetical protein
MKPEYRLALPNAELVFEGRILTACLNGSNIVGPTSSNNVTIIDMTASLSNIFG